jgi:hypothetical protein
VHETAIVILLLSLTIDDCLGQRRALFLNYQTPPVEE